MFGRVTLFGSLFFSVSGSLRPQLSFSSFLSSSLLIQLLWGMLSTADRQCFFGMLVLHGRSAHFLLDGLLSRHSCLFGNSLMVSGGEWDNVPWIWFWFIQPIKWRVLLALWMTVVAAADHRWTCKLFMPGSRSSPFLLSFAGAANDCCCCCWGCSLMPHRSWRYCADMDDHDTTLLAARWIQTNHSGEIWISVVTRLAIAEAGFGWATAAGGGTRQGFMHWTSLSVNESSSVLSQLRWCFHCFCLVAACTNISPISLSALLESLMLPIGCCLCLCCSCSSVNPGHQSVHWLIN